MGSACIRNSRCNNLSSLTAEWPASVVNALARLCWDGSRSDAGSRIDHGAGFFCLFFIIRGSFRDIVFLFCFFVFVFCFLFFVFFLFAQLCREWRKRKRRLFLTMNGWGGCLHFFFSFLRLDVDPLEYFGRSLYRRDSAWLFSLFCLSFLSTWCLRSFYPWE